MTQFKRPESVLVIISDEQGRILALRRMDDASFWQSVTGSLEADESPLAAALREVHEEVGIDVLAEGYEMVDIRLTNQYEIRPEWRYRYPPGEFVNTEYTFLLQIDSHAKITLTEHDQHQWLTAAEAVNLFWSPSNRAVIERFFLSESAPQETHS
ncbi:MAG: dihydroneopterin triphosphate diphosphatase [Aestuariibacter sp.]